MKDFELTKDVQGWLEAWMKKQYPTGNLNGKFSNEAKIEAIIAYLECL